MTLTIHFTGWLGLEIVENQFSYLYYVWWHIAEVNWKLNHEIDNSFCILTENEMFALEYYNLPAIGHVKTWDFLFLAQLPID